MGKWITYLIYALESLADILFYSDDSCLICGREDSNHLCRDCRSKIKKTDQPSKITVDDESILVYTYAYYGNVLREMMLRLKYKKEYRAAQLFSLFLYEKLNETEFNIDVITYIPIREESREKRGYNQCFLMAKGLSKLTGIETSELLTAEEGAKDQIGLTGMERFKNMEGKFKLICNSKYKNKNILLIDDVLTTGATVYQGLKVLKKYYSGNIYILTVAKSRL